MKDCLARPILVVALAMLSTACAGGSPSPTPTTLSDSPTPHLTPSATPAVTPTALPTLSPTLSPTSTSTPLPPTTSSPLGPWEPLPIAGLPGPRVNDIAFATPTTVFIVAADDVYRSNDAGATWSLSLSIYRGMRSLAVSPAYAADQTVFAIDGRSLLFRSTDGGETWEEMVQIAPIGGASDADVYLSISPAYPADPTLWVTIEGGPAYRSTDGGLTWEEFDPGFTLPPTTRLVPNPNYPADPTLTAVDPTAVQGVSLPQDLSAHPLTLAKSEGTLLLGTTRGLYRSTDDGATWTEANSGLPASPVGTVAVAPDGALYASVGGEPRLFRLLPGDERWDPLGRLPEGDFGPPTVYGVTVPAPSALAITTDIGLLVSHDDGRTWERARGEGLPPARPGRYELLLSADFAESGLAHLVYLGKVYQTVDGGDSWTQVEGLRGVEKLAETPDGRWIGLDRSTVYERDPETGQWVSHPANFGGNPTTVRFVTDQLAVAVVDEDFHLSQDGGRSWTRIGESSLDYAYGYLISPRFDADRAIYARGATAIYISTDAGRTWVEATEGLPPCEYYDSPECDVALLEAARSDGGYTIYASVRHDFHTRIWSARAITDDD